MIFSYCKEKVDIKMENPNRRFITLAGVFFTNIHFNISKHFRYIKKMEHKFDMWI